MTAMDFNNNDSSYSSGYDLTQKFNSISLENSRNQDLVQCEENKNNGNIPFVSKRNIPIHNQSEPSFNQPFKSTHYYNTYPSQYSSSLNMYSTTNRLNIFENSNQYNSESFTPQSLSSQYIMQENITPRQRRNSFNECVNNKDIDEETFCQDDMVYTQSIPSSPPRNQIIRNGYNNQPLTPQRNTPSANRIQSLTNGNFLTEGRDGSPYNSYKYLSSTYSPIRSKKVSRVSINDEEEENIHAAGVETPFKRTKSWDSVNEKSPWSRSGEPVTNVQTLDNHFSYSSLMLNQNQSTNPINEDQYKLSSSLDNNSSFFNFPLFMNSNEDQFTNAKFEHHQEQRRRPKSSQSYREHSNNNVFNIPINVAHNQENNNKQRIVFGNTSPKKPNHKRGSWNMSNNPIHSNHILPEKKRTDHPRFVKTSHFKKPQDKKPETAADHSMYKKVLTDLKIREKEGYEYAKEYFLSNSHKLKDSQLTKLHLDIAEIAKRANKNEEARIWYTKVHEIDPTIPQAWLEHAKLEEEDGELEKCDQVLSEGLSVKECRYNESLIVKYIKFQEQRGELDAARIVLARMKNINIDKSWKIVLEGALLESRAGNIETARNIFAYLISHVSRHGGIYLEAYKLEEKCENYENAKKIVRKGLDNNSRYGPLWFAYFHILEKTSNGNLSELRNAVEESVDKISKELIWKVYYEFAQIEERHGNIEGARNAYAKSINSALKNLRWKVWIAGARTEINQNSNKTARLLLNRALQEVPTKSRAVVLIECSRLEEYVGNISKAREFLSRAQTEAKHEWKVYLEAILLEIRNDCTQKAIEVAQQALAIHRGTGRLWAVLIQLMYKYGYEKQYEVFKQALKEVPKSGEVWCEGARLHMNPVSPLFNLKKARIFLDFAIKFTPQYGDSLIEYVRLNLLEKGPQDEERNNALIEKLCINADPNYGLLWMYCKDSPLDSTREILKRANVLLVQELIHYRSIYQRSLIGDKSGIDIQDDPGSEINYKYFISGIHMINIQMMNPNIVSLETKKKFVFGSDL